MLQGKTGTGTALVMDRHDRMKRDAQDAQEPKWRWGRSDDPWLRLSRVGSETRKRQVCWKQKVDTGQDWGGLCGWGWTSDWSLDAAESLELKAAVVAANY